MEIKYIHSEDIHNNHAAKELIPILKNLFNIKDVLDVGCGIGTWLSEFKKQGIKTILGVDGEYVNKDLLYKNITPEEFKSFDLNKSFDCNQKYSLVLSLEVAEHIEEKNARTFIHNLSNHGDNILFSAAIPFQGGQNHINEQRPDYWIKIFKSYGYNVYDIIRPLIWDNSKIFWWYKQNTFLFSKQKLNVDQYESFNERYLLHPEFYQLKVDTISSLQKELLYYKFGLSDKKSNRVSRSFKYLLNSIKSVIRILLK